MVELSLSLRSEAQDFPIKYPTYTADATVASPETASPPPTPSNGIHTFTPIPLTAAYLIVAAAETDADALAPRAIPASALSLSGTAGFKLRLRQALHQRWSFDAAVSAVGVGLFTAFTVTRYSSDLQFEQNTQLAPSANVTDSEHREHSFSCI